VDEVADVLVEASAEGTIEGAWMMTVLVLVEVRPFWSVVSGSRIEPMRPDIEEGDTRTLFVEKDKQYPEPCID
jgi:hypothetical protein